MKTTRFLFAIALMASFTFLSTAAMAQRGEGRMMMERPANHKQMNQEVRCGLELTTEQEAKIKEIRVKHIAEVTPLKNELGEKYARLRTLQSVDKPDLNAINKIIDEISVIKANIQKKGAAHKVAVASLLTPEQKVIFNANHSKRMGKGNRMGGKGMGKGMNRCL
jgi:Spy/CpxP family protein refolding chaperone